MAIIRDSAVTIYSSVTTSMVMEMPTHIAGDLLVAFVNKDTSSAFTTPANWNAIRTVLSAGAAGGVYTKWAASSSETVTFALTSETCNGIVIAIQGAEAEITSSAAQINVVAAGGTYTRTTGSFTTDGFTAGQTVIMSGHTNAGNNGPKEISTITGSGTIITVTSTSGLVNETGSGNELVKSTGLDLSAASGADDVTLPMTGIGLTPIANNCLILHGLSSDLGIGPNALPPWINLFSGDSGANSLCVSYSFKPTAGAITAPDHWAGIETGADNRSVIIAVRDGSSGVYIPAYLPLSTTPATQITPLNGSDGTVDKGTYSASTITPVAGKTVTDIGVNATGDSGINPYRGSLRNTGSSSTTNLNHVRLTLTAAVDLTLGEGLLFGTYLNLAPRDYVDSGKASQGGVYIIIGSSNTAWVAWVVGGQFSKTEKSDARNNYLIEVSSSDTIYSSNGTATLTAIDEFAFGGASYYGNAAILWNELYRLSVVILAGGSATSPFDFEDLIFAVNQGCGILPLMQQSGSVATLWCPLRFGGTEAIAVTCNLNTFQYPRKADEIDYVDFHLTANKIGVEFYGTSSSDYLYFTNCVFTSPSAYYWRFNANHSADAQLDFSGTSVVYATVTLQSTVTLTGVIFIQCNEIILNGGNLTSCTLQQQRVGDDYGAVAFTSATEGDGVTYCTFIDNNDGDLGHSIRISTAGTYTFAGHTFSGGGPAAIAFHTQTDVDATNDEIDSSGHGYTTGDGIYYQDQGGTDTIGLTDGNLYYVRAVTVDALSFHVTKAEAIANTGKVGLTDGTAGQTHYLYSAKADVYNSSGSGTVTINVTGSGDIPTIRNANSSTTVINYNVTLEVNGVVQNTQCYIVPTAGGSELMNEAATTSVSGNEYKATESYNYTTDTVVTIRARELGYLPFETTGTVTNAGLTVTAVWLVDPNWKLVVSGINIQFTNPTTITRASGDFGTDGWLAVMGQVTVEGSTSNNGTYTLSVIGTTTVTISGATLVNEGPSSGITLTFTRRSLT